MQDALVVFIISDYYYRRSHLLYHKLSWRCSSRATENSSDNWNLSVFLACPEPLGSPYCRALFCLIISLCMTLLLLCNSLCVFLKHGLSLPSGSAVLCIRWAGGFREMALDSQLTALALIRTRCRAGTPGETGLLIKTGSDWTTLEPADTLSTHPQLVGCHQSGKRHIIGISSCVFILFQRPETYQMQVNEQECS